MKIGEYDIYVSDGLPCGYPGCSKSGVITVSGKEYCKEHFARQYLSGQTGIGPRFCLSY